MRVVIHPNFPNYRIRENGIITRIKKTKGGGAGVILRGYAYPGTKYIMHEIVNRNGKRVRISAHRLILEAFNGAPPTKEHQCAHYDGSRTNNHINNLRWATPKENMSDRGRHGRNQIGIKNCKAKLTEGNIKVIRSLYTGKYGQLSQIGRQFNIKPNTVDHIVKNRHWRHLLP